MDLTSFVRVFNTDTTPHVAPTAAKTASMANCTVLPAK